MSRTHFSISYEKGKIEDDEFHDEFYDEFDRCTRFAEGSDYERAQKFRFLSNEIISNILEHDVQADAVSIDFSFNRDKSMTMKVLYKGIFFDQNALDSPAKAIQDFCAKEGFKVSTTQPSDERIKIEINMPSEDILFYEIDKSDHTILEIVLKGKFQRGSSQNAKKFENARAIIRTECKGKLLLLNLSDLEFWDTRGINAVMENAKGQKTAIVIKSSSPIYSSYQSALQKSELEHAKKIRIFETSDDAKAKIKEW